MKNKGYLFRAHYSKGVSHHHSSNSRAGRGTGTFFSGKKGKLQVFLIGGRWHGEAVGRLPRRGILCDG